MNIYRREYVDNQGYHQLPDPVWWNGYISFSQTEQIEEAMDCLCNYSLPTSSFAVCYDSWGRLFAVTTVG